MSYVEEEQPRASRSVSISVVNNVVIGGQEESTEDANLGLIFEREVNSVWADEGDYKQFSEVKFNEISKIIKTFVLNHGFKDKRGTFVINLVNESCIGYDDDGNRTTGMTYCDGNVAYIIIATRTKSVVIDVMHEMVHALQYFNSDVFSEFEEEWSYYDTYVTEYASTDIDEDYAETGKYFLTGDTASHNPKYAIFKRIWQACK